MQEVKDINPQQLEQWLEGGEALLIDVRETWEFRSGFIPGAINIPLDSIDTALAIIEAENPKYIVLQCKSGMRSLVAAEQLRSAGLGLEFYNLKGGILDWMSCGLPVSVMQ